MAVYSNQAVYEYTMLTFDPKGIRLYVSTRHDDACPA